MQDAVPQVDGKPPGPHDSQSFPCRPCCDSDEVLGLGEAHATLTGRENGTGLGLALVSKIVSDHDGWISVDSVPGRTVFRLSLPMAPKDKRKE